MLSKRDLSIYLMDAWFYNLVGDWARELAFKLQREYENELIKERLNEEERAKASSKLQGGGQGTTS